MIYLLIFLKKLLSNVFVLQKSHRHKNAIFVIARHFISCHVRKTQDSNCDCPVIFTFK